MERAQPDSIFFWTGTREDYFKLYQYAAQAVKAVNPAYRVSGPLRPARPGRKRTDRFCYRNKLLLDFISTHTYGVKQGFLDEYGNSGTVLAREKMP